MGKCVRIRGSSKPPSPPGTAAAFASSCLTLRSGRRVMLPVAASSSLACSARTTSGRPRRRHRGSPTSQWCGGGGGRAAAKKSACRSSPRHSGAADAGSLEDDEEEVPSRVAAVSGGVDRGRGDIFDRRAKTPLLTADCDHAAVAKTKAKHEINESHGCRIVVVAGQTPSPSPPTEAEIESFFAAAELAERRRFTEAYNYDVALDRPLEGRFEWAPVRT